MLTTYIKFSAMIMAAALIVGCQTTKPMNYASKKITGLKTPESVVQAKDGRIFISEINEFGKDGDGQIRVVNNDGSVAVFASGLDDPKGLVIIGDYLYVADKTKVLKITPNGQVSVFVPATAFPNVPYFLNDLESDLQGNLYVSDSGDLFNTGKGAAIYKVAPSGEVKLLIKDIQDARVKAPNGLLADDTGNHLIYVDFTSGVLYSLNTLTGALSDLAEGFGGGDGVVHHSSGVMYVSDWKNGKVFSVNMMGDVTLVRSGYQAAADIAITKDERYLLVPDMKAGELDFIPLSSSRN
ncbi:SMP-30/gluconolactonase/LRE family protein [Methylotenera mobilis]|jgi:sugar lactone lactonase YvrE|uniref:SMP-30/gluconolactonase/LRE family protein n=1 Tax=Methylotenera mobilis TaxID=359408 RepID=UPI0003788494|nr:SMP-30/gluconolactonase/LRE family protein [Methylotenera mobilis]PPC96382.1 MAG: gluconolaconase [Methylotenera sp.]